MKLLQINIEYDKHLDTVQNFITRENPDVVCMQEVLERNYNDFKSQFNLDGAFVPMDIVKEQKRGVAIYSKYKLYNTQIDYYRKPTEQVTNEVKGVPETHTHCIVLAAEINIDDMMFNVVTTHFPVHYPGHEVSDFQKECFVDMDNILKKKSEFIFTGDTNCPRGTELFDALARDYKDNIPQDVLTTIDEKIHRNGFLPYVIDCLFTTPEYTATDVRLVSGVSDHLGIVAEIEKTV